MTTITVDSGRTYDGFDLAAALMAAAQMREMAAALDRKGGGFTAHCSAILRAKAARCEAQAAFLEREFADAGVAA